MKRMMLVVLAVLLNSQQVVADEQFEQCLNLHFQTADDSLTLGELRQLCQLDSPQQELTDEDKLQSELQTSAITRRVLLEKTEEVNPFALLPHKPNYIMLSNNLASPHEAPFELADPNKDINFQPWETKFQISLKVPVLRGLFNDRADLFVAYTNRSFWQQFNKAGSSPFRDSNHEPEIWLSFKNDQHILGLKNSVIRTGISHQSNGQSGVLSRSWNRVYADFLFERGNWYFSLKPWWRIPENFDDDDNPDIEEYLGNFELGGVYQAGKHNFEFMLRNNFDFGDNKGALQLGWSFPLTKRVRGYVQWFNGYGESLIDYNAYTNSIGLGVQLSDWL